MISFDPENDFLHGQIVGIKDVVTFQGQSVSELRKAFEESVDDYLEFCKERGEKPDKPFSGRFLLRMSPDLHRRLAELASEQGQSLNNWIVTRLETVACSSVRAGPIPVTHARSAKSKKQSSKKKLPPKKQHA
ncbi:MAG TPA: type II toxin-antitoxin system HicB family antitoxin [Pirellulales bacterium]|nr:type II toxin-antitoxin system HicB family antitoxin [Pirellulales bacterium]